MMLKLLYFFFVFQSECVDDSDCQHDRKCRDGSCKCHDVKYEGESCEQERGNLCI
jgi:hypothetical protein